MDWKTGVACEQEGEKKLFAFQYINTLSKIWLCQKFPQLENTALWKSPLVRPDGFARNLIKEDSSVYLRNKLRWDIFTLQEITSGKHLLSVILGKTLTMNQMYPLAIPPLFYHNSS